MTRLRLLLLRHAKSDWGDPSQIDFERPLNNRGRKAAKKMGRFMRENDLVPERILCSTAERARQTLALAQPELRAPDNITFTDDLYAFSGFQAPLNVIRREGNRETPLLIIAHNPSMEDLAFELTGAGNSTARALMHQKYPTAALAVIDFDINAWEQLQTGIGTLVKFVRPADI